MPGLNWSADIIEVISAAPTFLGSFLANVAKRHETMIGSLLDTRL